VSGASGQQNSTNYQAPNFQSTGNHQHGFNDLFLDV
jgi:hypothetical protein